MLDLDLAAGIEVLLSAKRVGPTGKTHGPDMTGEMLALAREDARRAGVENVDIAIERTPPGARPCHLSDHPCTRAGWRSGMNDPHKIHLHDPQTLYRHWEDSQWSPWEIDLGVDQSSGRASRTAPSSVFVLGSLMVAEERITTKFSGLVGANGSEEEISFLATQQVDEARHMQFYGRFQDEVVADPAPIAVHVERARAQARQRSARSSTRSSSRRTSGWW